MSQTEIALKLRGQVLIDASSSKFLQSESTSTMRQEERQKRKSQLRERTGLRLLYGARAATIESPDSDRHAQSPPRAKKSGEP
jgi:hypothetical protein